MPLPCRSPPRLLNAAAHSGLNPTPARPSPRDQTPHVVCNTVCLFQIRLTFVAHWGLVVSGRVRFRCRASESSASVASSRLSLCVSEGPAERSWILLDILDDMLQTSNGWRFGACHRRDCQMTGAKPPITGGESQVIAELPQLGHPLQHRTPSCSC